MSEDAFVHHALLPRSIEWIPERRLMLAVLEDAIDVLQKYYLSPEGSRGQRIFEEGSHWIASDNTRWPFSFRNICDALDLDPTYIRNGIERWRSRRINEAIEHARTQQLRRHRD